MVGGRNLVRTTACRDYAKRLERRLVQVLFQKCKQDRLGCSRFVGFEAHVLENPYQDYAAFAERLRRCVSFSMDETWSA